MKSFNFLLAGVGGQGTLLASDIVAEVGMDSGFDVKKSEVHGMSQRGGAVTSHVRWGEMVASPLSEKGTVHFFIAQEILESLRWIEYLAPDGTVLLSDQKLPPTSTVFGEDQYPSEDHALKTIQEAAETVLYVRARQVAEDLGNPRVANSVLLGALSTLVDISKDEWLRVISERVPERHVEINRQAFTAGRDGDWKI